MHSVYLLRRRKNVAILPVWVKGFDKRMSMQTIIFSETQRVGLMMPERGVIRNKRKMKNNDSSLLSGSKQAVDYMVREITHICRDMKKRAPGSEGEREAAEYMADILKNECGCSDIRIESFDVHPGGFYGYLYFSFVLDVLCGAAFSSLLHSVFYPECWRSC